MFRRILKSDNFDWQAIRFLHLDIALEHSKTMWQTQAQDTGNYFMQLFQQWLQVAAAIRST